VLLHILGFHKIWSFFTISHFCFQI
jgi:hypothetical protein